ncbi:MAG TPA: TolC family protein [Longimicrobium sp.]|jgi:outer membrane protein
MRTLLRRPGAALALALAAPAALAAQVTPPPPPAPAAASVRTDGPTLTLEQAVATARERNPDMLMQRNDVRSTRAALRAARFDFLPSADVSGSLGYQAPGEQRAGAFRLAQSSPPYYSSSYNLGIGYRLDGQKLMEPAIARANDRATRERIEGYEANLVSQVSQQYLTALQALEQVAQAEREVGRTQEHERLARARLEVGAGTPLDLRRAEVQRGQAAVAVVQRKNTYQTELLRLGRLMGTLLPPDTKLASTFQLFAPRWSADELVAMALAGNPNLDAARASARAARTGVRAARTQYLPSVSFRMGFGGSVYSAGDLDPLIASELRNTQGQFNGCLQGNELNRLLGKPEEDCSPFNTQLPTVADSVRRSVRSQNPSFPFGFSTQPMTASLSLSLPIFNGLQRERQIEEARVQAQDAELAVQRQELDLRTDIAGALLAVQTAYETAQLQEQVVQKASEELRLAQERFRFGVASSVEVTDAQTSLSEAERARIDAIFAYHKSLAALEALVGRRLR